MGLDHDLRSLATRHETGISFAEFMRLALYHPQEGYYATPKPIGRSGDFFTSVSVGPCFAFLLARQFRQIQDVLFPQAPMDVVEQGAHDGQLAADLIAQAGPDSRPPWRYRIVEPNVHFRQAQTARLAHLAQIQPSLSTAAPINGVYLCNELLDAFPVRRLRFESGRWREIRVVGTAAGALSQAVFDLPSALTRWPRLPTDVAEGFETEVCEEIDPWLDELSAAMHQGVALIIDYGGSTQEAFLPERANGSLRGYREHRLITDPLEFPGKTDLTADVNFSHVWQSARARGWRLLGYADQAQFLTGIAAALPDPEQFPRSLLRQFQTLVHPGIMGRRFRILGLGRETPPDLQLDGFRFSGPGALDPDSHR